MNLDSSLEIIYTFSKAYPIKNPMNYFLGSNLCSQNDSYTGMNSSKNLYMQLLIDWFEVLFKTELH